MVVVQYVIHLLEPGKRRFCKLVDFKHISGQYAVKTMTETAMVIWKINVEQLTFWLRVREEAQYHAHMWILNMKPDSQIRSDQTSKASPPKFYYIDTLSHLFYLYYFLFSFFKAYIKGSVGGGGTDIITNIWEKS